MSLSKWKWYKRMLEDVAGHSELHIQVEVTVQTHEVEGAWWAIDEINGMEFDNELLEQYLEGNENYEVIWQRWLQ